MNVYALRTIGEVEVISQTEVDPAEFGLICEIVVAPTSGKAKWEVCRDYGLPFTTRFSIHKLATDYDQPEGNIFQWDGKLRDDFMGLMVHASVIEHGMSEAEEYMQWLGFEYGDEAKPEFDFSIFDVG